MRKAAGWIKILLGLLATSVLLSTALITSAELSLGAILLVSGILMLVLGIAFMVGFWIANWTSDPRYSQTRVLHEQKMMRHEINQLREQVSQRDRLVELLRSNIRQMQEEHILKSAPPSPIRTTQVAQAVPPQSAFQTGTYQRVNYEPPMNGQSAYQTSTQSRIHVENPASQTDVHPRYQTGEYPAVPMPPTTLPKLDETSTSTYTTVNTNGHRPRVARLGSRRNGVYRR